ncbi:MAG: HMA2 domain-containing protein [Salinibacter sp.]
MATYLHAIDGRLRVRLPALRGDRRAAARLRRTARTLPGVATANVNPLTGSLLVEYDDERLSRSEILDALGVEPPDSSGQGQSSLLGAVSAEASPKVQDVVAEKMVEFAAERLLLAVLA